MSTRERGLVRSILQTLVTPLAGILSQLNITGTVLAKYIRWGRNLEPTWVHGVAQATPVAGAVLVTRTVSANLSGYFWGFLISSQEMNNFLINWTSGGTAYSIRIVFAGSGTTECVDPIPLNEGLPATAGTTITITNVTAGGATMIYQARLLYGEV